MNCWVLLLSFLSVFYDSNGLHISENQNLTIGPSERKPTPKSCDCGRSLTRIIGGSEVTLNKYPWMVALCIGYPCRFGNFICGATLINMHYVVTAAHCTFGQTAEQLSVSLGDFDISTGSDTISLDRNISKILQHILFIPITFQNDISLLALSELVEFSDQIRPICLPSPRADDFEGEVATAIGWGTTDLEGNRPNKFREVNLKIVSNEFCEAEYFLIAYITRKMMCAAETGKDTCYGDSGGSLALKNSLGSWEIIGITSFGQGCADPNYPGVYTRVSSYVDWIKKNIGDSSIYQCIK